MVFSGLWPGNGTVGALPELASGDYIVCADGGYAICAAAGIRPAAVIGDFDSLSAELIDEIGALGIERVIHPGEKDDTDTMLCVKYGLERGFDRFLIIGGIGGDFGHTVANLQVLSFLTDMRRKAEIVTGRERVMMVDGETAQARGETSTALGGTDLPEPLVFTGRPGLRFSVLSYAERSSGVCIRNAKYELSDAALTHSCPLGVSNECMNAEPVTVLVRYGRLLVVVDI